VPARAAGADARTHSHRHPRERQLPARRLPCDRTRTGQQRRRNQPDEKRDSPAALAKALVQAVVENAADAGYLPSEQEERRCARSTGLLPGSWRESVVRAI